MLTHRGRQGVLIWQIREINEPRPKRSRSKSADLTQDSQGLRGGGSKEEVKQKTCTETRRQRKEWWREYRWIEDYDIVHLMQQWMPDCPIPIIKAPQIIEEIETIYQRTS